ncbi:MAG TPA: galactokinase [Caulobacteraceae bacterium]|nr:galactokinase [Caulobacteraceae bacterium]
MPRDQSASSDLTPPARAKAAFQRRFDGAPRLFRAPGRINIIGEHVDYAGGLVLPAAIDRQVVVAARANGSLRLTVASGAMGAETAVDLGALAASGGWIDYIAGVAQVLGAAGVAVPGADIWIESDLAIGAGLSSSAALEVAVACALLALAGATADGAQIARWARDAENDFVGAPCGIMDQFAAANGVAGAALLLDCATLAAEPIPLPETARFLIVDTATSHAHAEGEYSRRREECEVAARLLGVDQLAAVTDLPVALERLPETLARRCRHVVTEIARVRAAVEALARADLAQLGSLLDQSHVSLRDDMQVSTDAVDRLVAIAQATPGVLGARMMGGGFGGSIIAIVDAALADAALAGVRDRFAAVIGKTPEAFLCRAVGGAGEIAA